MATIYMEFNHNPNGTGTVDSPLTMAQFIDLEISGTDDFILIQRTSIVEPTKAFTSEDAVGFQMAIIAGEASI